MAAVPIAVADELEARGEPVVVAAAEPATATTVAKSATVTAEERSFGVRGIAAEALGEDVVMGEKPHPLACSSAGTPPG